MVLLRYRGGSNSRLISGLGSLDYSFEQRLQPDIGFPRSNMGEVAIGIGRDIEAAGIKPDVIPTVDIIDPYDGSKSFTG